MKILAVGRNSKYNAEYFYEKAFRELGHKVILANMYEGVKHQLFKRQLYARTRSLNLLLSSYWINRSLPKIVDSYDPDAVIIFKGEFISVQTIKLLSESRKIYLYYPDTYKFRPLLDGRVEYYQTVFTAANNKKFYYDLGARNVVTVPWSCDPDFHRKLSVEKKYKISFIGTAYPERRRIIRKLKGVDVFGDFWYGFGKSSHNPVYGEDYIRTINQSLINLNLQAKISVDADAPTMRTFEVAGCGGFQISDHMPSLRRYFPDIPTFRDVNELRELISYYSESDEDRENIADKCMKKCRDFFKYTDSAKLIIASL